MAPHNIKTSKLELQCNGLRILLQQEFKANNILTRRFYRDDTPIFNRI